MYFVNNQLYINFDHLLDIDSLLKIKPGISAFIARNQHRVKPTKYLKGNFLISANGIGDYQLDATKHPEKYGDPEIITDLIANDLFGSYIVFEQDVLHGSMSCVPRYAKNYATKHLSQDCVAIPEDSQFDFFYKWLDQQNIFTDYGRVTIFINHPGSSGAIHRDYPDQDRANADQFIWISFNSRKQFFLYNNHTQEKTYIPGHCNWFNTGNWHGSDVVTQSGYTLRVDGVYSSQFLDKLNGLN